MQEFLEFVLRQLIDFPEDMVLTRVDAPKKATFKLQLRQSDIGKVIGKHGQTIIALRNLLAAGAARHGERAFLEIIEDAPPAHPGATAAPQREATSNGSSSQSSETEPNLG